MDLHPRRKPDITNSETQPTTHPRENTAPEETQTSSLHESKSAAPDLIRQVLQENEEWYQDLFERALVGICWVETRTGRFLGANPKFCEIVGRTQDDVLRRTFQSITHPDDLMASLENLRRLAEGEVRHYEIEKRYIQPDGTIRWVEVEIVAMGSSDRPFWHMGIMQDVTERRLAQERQREYERVIEGLDEVILVIDRDYRYVIANRAFLNRHRKSREQVLGHTLAEVLPESAWKLAKPKLDECFQGEVVHYEMKHTYPGLGERDLFLSYFPIEGPSGVDRIAAILQDVTERKRAEYALMQHQEQYRLFVSQSSEGIFSEEMTTPVPIDLPEDEIVQRILHEAHIAECNDALAAMYGFEKAGQLQGRMWRSMMPADDPQNIEMTRQYVRSGFRLVEHRSHEVDAHGNSKDFSNSLIGTVEDGKLVRTWGIQRDITQTVQLQEDREKADKYLRQALSTVCEVTEELRQAKQKLTEEKLYLEQSIDDDMGYGEIIGRSAALRYAMGKITKVAPSDATVLLLGETGTGKELAARALHGLSRRQGKGFIKVNCAAIPSGLLESELFGHEKGAFTGALGRKVGRLELADGGTLFLDEIGEVALSLQPKLLHALQDMEFERLGSTQTIRVNFRLVAATNRDLLRSVKAGEFRSDLYYRLNVFPVLMPPLRERREDIRPLIEHFVRLFASRMKKSITHIPTKTMEELVRWEWPGNIRELENFVERSVILTPGSVLQSPLWELRSDSSLDSAVESLQDVDRQKILKALHECRGKLGGPDGAAARLGLKRTTLQSKLDQLGIKPGEFRT
jgi:PAS domain S-box-containing protein